MDAAAARLEDKILRAEQLIEEAKRFCSPEEYALRQDGTYEELCLIVKRQAETVSCTMPNFLSLLVTSTV
jgi:hypothetical protein